MTTSAATQDILVGLGYLADFSVSAHRFDPSPRVPTSSNGCACRRRPTGHRQPTRSAPVTGRWSVPLSGHGAPFVSGMLYIVGARAMRRFGRSLAAAARAGAPLVYYLFHSYEFTGLATADHRPWHHRLYRRDPEERYRLNAALLRWLVGDLGLEASSATQYLSAGGTRYGYDRWTHRRHSPPARAMTMLPLAVSAVTSTPLQRPVSRTGCSRQRTEVLARTLRTPQYLILFVSDRCWMRCAHCWFNEAWKERELTRPPLTFEEYEKLARSIKQLHFLSLTGGEAFQRDDIVELATMFRKTCRLGRYQIPTSGYRTARIVEAAERLLLANPGTPFRVDVSLDGVQAVHNGIRRISDGFDRAVATIKALNSLKRRFAHFDVGVITTISRTNQATVREISALVEEIHPDGEWMVNIARGGGRDPTATEVDPAAYRLAHELIEASIARGAYKGHGGIGAPNGCRPRTPRAATSSSRSSTARGRAAVVRRARWAASSIPTARSRSARCSTRRSATCATTTTTSHASGPAPWRGACDAGSRRPVASAHRNASSRSAC
jgi:uncharacterized radical SAM superfamily Fe-S cluster-containing enzyme